MLRATPACDGTAQNWLIACFSSIVCDSRLCRLKSPILKRNFFMDRDRLKDIQTADLSESNMNEDFVLWLKTKGPTYLLFFMVIIAAYLFYVRYEQDKNSYRAEAWIAHLEAVASGLPASHEDVAVTYADVDSIEGLGYISAGDAYLKSFVLNKTVGNALDASATALSEDDRTFYLEKADLLYSKAVGLDDNSPESTLIVISGLNGRAAVAESRGEIESAEQFYNQVITRVGTQYPALAKQAEVRISGLQNLTVAIQLPTDAEVSAQLDKTENRDATPNNTTIDALSELTDSPSN